MRYEGKEVHDDFVRLFGHEPTPEQLWFLTKMAKHVRLRARNNAAFNNYMNRCFGPRFRFAQVEKRREDGTTYPGLSITDTASGSEAFGADESNEAA